MQVNAARRLRARYTNMAIIYKIPEKWLPVSVAPADRDLEVCVIDKQGIHALVFACRHRGTDWVDPSTQKRIDIKPTHWRIWTEDRH